MPKTFTTLRLSQQLKHYKIASRQRDRFVLAVFLFWTNVYNIERKQSDRR